MHMDGTDAWHRGCAYTVLQMVQMPEVCSDVFDTVHCTEPLKSFDNPENTKHF